MINAVRVIAFLFLGILSLTTSAEMWKVGADQNFPPYVVSENGSFHGIHVDIVDAVMNRMGVDYILMGYPWAGVVAVTDNDQDDPTFLHFPSIR